MSTVMEKKPGELLDYEIDFARWLSESDIIVDASATIDDGTATLDRVVFSESQVQVWIHGGEDGESASVRVSATTEQGRVKEFCFRLRVRDCC